MSTIRDTCQSPFDFDRANLLPNSSCGRPPVGTDVGIFLPADHVPDKRKQSDNARNFPEQRAHEKWRPVRQLSAGRSWVGLPELSSKFLVGESNVNDIHIRIHSNGPDAGHFSCPNYQGYTDQSVKQAEPEKCRDVVKRERFVPVDDSKKQQGVESKRDVGQQSQQRHQRRLFQNPDADLVLMSMLIAREK